MPAIAILDTESSWLYDPPIRLELRAVVANLENGRSSKYGRRVERFSHR